MKVSSGERRRVDKKRRGDKEKRNWTGRSIVERLRKRKKNKRG